MKPQKGCSARRDLIFSRMIYKGADFISFEETVPPTGCSCTALP